MGVFSRVYKIFRANLLSKKQHDLFDDKDFQNVFSKNYRYQEKSSSRDYSTKTETNRDHEIARYYANLEIPYGSDLATVRKAWKKLLRKYHPDLHSDDPEKIRIANKLVQGLNKAHEELEKRLK